MALELLIVTEALHRCITTSTRERELHGSAEELKALDVVDGFLGSVDGVEDHEGLAFRLEVRLSHDIDDLAILGEELHQRLLELRDLDRLLEISAVYANRYMLEGTRTCRSAMTRTWRSVGGY